MAIGPSLHLPHNGASQSQRWRAAALQLSRAVRIDARCSRWCVHDLPGTLWTGVRRAACNAAGSRYFGRTRCPESVRHAVDRPHAPDCFRASSYTVCFVSPGGTALGRQGFWIPRTSEKAHMWFVTSQCDKPHKNVSRTIGP